MWSLPLCGVVYWYLYLFSLESLSRRAPISLKFWLNRQSLAWSRSLRWKFGVHRISGASVHNLEGMWSNVVTECVGKAHIFALLLLVCLYIRSLPFGSTVYHAAAGICIEWFDYTKNIFHIAVLGCQKLGQSLQTPGIMVISTLPIALLLF